MEEVPDEELLECAARGGPRARRAVLSLYDRYARKFMAFLAFKGVTGPDAEDVVHDVFCKLLALPRSERRIENGRAYLFGVLTNALTDHWRRVRRSASAPPETETSRDGEAGACVPVHEELRRDGEEPDDQISLRECLEKAYQAFQSTNHERASVIYLAAVEQWTPRDIAEYLGRTYGATRQYMSQCMQHFRQFVRRFCPEHVERLVAS